MGRVSKPLAGLRTTAEPRVVMPSNAVVPSTEDVSGTLTLNFRVSVVNHRAIGIGRSGSDDQCGAHPWIEFVDSPCDIRRDLGGQKSSGICSSLVL